MPSIFISEIKVQMRVNCEHLLNVSHLNENIESLAEIFLNTSEKLSFLPISIDLQEKEVLI